MQIINSNERDEKISQRSVASGKRASRRFFFSTHRHTDLSARYRGRVRFDLESFNQKQGRRNDRRRSAGHAQGSAAVSRRPGATLRVEFPARGPFHSRRKCPSESEPRPFARRSGGNRRIIFVAQKNQDVRGLRRLVA